MEEKNQPRIIEMIDNEGAQVKAELYDIVECEGQKYALLMPVQEEDGEDQPSLAVMRLMQDGDQYYIEEIETDEEFDRVAAFLHSMSGCGCEGGECSCGDKNGECGCHCDEK